MREEDVTKILLLMFCKNNWKIETFDFPGSGTGKALHPKNAKGKTDGIWIPDIVVVKDNCALIMENKSFFSFSDVDKIAKIKSGGQYEEAIRALVGAEIHTLYFGVGIPSRAYTEMAQVKLEGSQVDFCFGVDEKKKIRLLYKSKCLSFGFKSFG